MLVSRSDRKTFGGGWRPSFCCTFHKKTGREGSMVAPLLDDRESKWGSWKGLLPVGSDGGGCPNGNKGGVYLNPVSGSTQV